jgi:hypothetical protein
MRAARVLFLALALTSVGITRGLAVSWETGGGGGGGTGTLTTVRPSNMQGTPPTSAQAPIASGSDDWVGRDIITEFTEPIMVYPEYSKSTANTFDSSASTNPYYGRIMFDANASSNTNCGIAIIDNFRNYTATVTSVSAVRIDQFRVFTGSVTDTGAQSYILRVASVTDNVSLPSTLNYPVTIAVSGGTASLKPRIQNTTTIVTAWAPIFDPGAPVMMEICRDGSDASGVNSWGGIVELRLATTSP